MNHLPQLEILPGLVERLYALPVVQSVYLGGSLSRGRGDIYSDLDLQVTVNPSCTDFLSDADITQVAGVPPLATVRFPLGTQAWMHHMILPSGIVVDLQCRHRIPAPELQQLVCLDRNCSPLTNQVATRPKAWAPEAISATEIGNLIQTFWITMHKHRRGIKRQQNMVIWVGIHHSTAQLLRLQFIAATDKDCGDLTRMGIYALSSVHEWFKGRGNTELLSEILHLGASLNWSHSVSRIAGKGSSICQLLRTRWELPARLWELEQMVTTEWQRSLDTPASVP